MKKLILIFTLLVLMGGTLLGQCPEYDLQVPHLVDIDLHNFVKKDTITNIFNYFYLLKNGSASTGCVRRLEIDLVYPLNSIELSSDGLIDYPKHIDRVKKEGIIPVGIPKLPRFRGFRSAWWAGFGVSNYVDWGASNRRFNLEPGAQLDSIIMTSHGLPSLRAFIVSPKYDPLPPVIVTPENEDSVRANVQWSYEEEMAFQRLEDSIKWRGFTIGPTASPNPFIPLNFLDTLTSYTTQSRTLGWIKDQTIANKYLGYYASVKTNLQQNNITSTRTILQQVLADVNTDSTSNLTSEAYALIHFNTEYLLAQLPQVIVPVPELIDNLRSKLQHYYANRQLGDRSFVQELDDNLKDAKRDYVKGDSIGCAQELEAFQQSIRKEYSAKPKRHDKRFVEEEAYKLLYYNAQYVIERAITLPPRSTGSVLNQISVLRAQVRTDAVQGIVGGELLLRGLVSTLDDAKQRLLRKDSVGTALYIEFFQQTIRRTYEITKKFSKSKLFVKAEGYISLYYRAGYIQGQLPETNMFGSSKPYLEPELEKELKGYEKEAVK
jgi:hypothetical protein